MIDEADVFASLDAMCALGVKEAAPLVRAVREQFDVDDRQAFALVREWLATFEPDAWMKKAESNVSGDDT